jgi:cytoskeletal protein CcmA (bactofilin family)
MFLASEESAGFLDNGTGITGNLHFVGTLRLDGDFRGTISADGILVVGETASIHAEIKVGKIEIAGRIYGNIEAKRVEILETGFVKGDVHTPVLVMEPGSTLDGRMSMLDASLPGPLIDDSEDVQVLNNRALAIPISKIFAAPFFVMRILAGLISR